MLEVPDRLADRLGGPLRDAVLRDQVLELATAKGTS